MRLLATPSVTRSWPAWARYGSAVLIVGLNATVQSVWHGTTGYPMLFYLGCVILCAVFFDQATSLIATVLSAAALAYISLEPRYSFAIESTQSIFALILFVALSLIAGFFIELLHIAVSRLHQTNQALRKLNLELASAEREKDLLLRESAHRAKNDFATLIALIRLEERKILDETARERLAKLADRAHVYARLQDRLSRAKQEQVVNTGEYVKDLCKDMSSMLAGVRPISVHVRAEDHFLPASQAVAVGLITNELVTNAVKHAFADDCAGTIDVTFVARGDEFLLCVEDDGRGFRGDGTQEGPPRGDGQSLVRAMAGQLNGYYELGPRKDRNGTVARVRFPLAQSMPAEIESQHPDARGAIPDYAFDEATNI